MGASVLVIEDDRELRTLFAMLLETAGMTVMQAARGDEGVDILREHAERIGVVVTDLSVPVLGGADLLQSLREAHPGAKLLCTSGRTDEETRREVLAAGADEFIPKPFHPPEMIVRIRSLLGTP